MTALWAVLIVALGIASALPLVALLWTDRR